MGKNGSGLGLYQTCDYKSSLPLVIDDQTTPCRARWTRFFLKMAGTSTKSLAVPISNRFQTTSKNNQKCYPLLFSRLERAKYNRPLSGAPNFYFFLPASDIDWYKLDHPTPLESKCLRRQSGRRKGGLHEASKEADPTSDLAEIQFVVCFRDARFTANDKRFS